MTSKNLFFKLIWQDLKKRIWCPIIIFVAFLLSMEVQLLNCLDRMKRYPTDFAYDMKHYLANVFFTPDGNSIILFMTGIAAAVCAFSGYAYLHSRKQLDTFHSMPIRRETLFFARYISGLVMFIVPFALHILFCLLIGLTNGAFSGHGVVNAVGFLGIQTVSFLLVYSLCILVVCLTGNMIISILGSCVLVGYSSIITGLKELLYDAFFYTYSGSYGEQIWAFSPVGMLINLFGDASKYREINTGFSYRCVISYSAVILFAILVFTLLGVVLYRKRATEAAGKPIAFSVAEPFVKSIVVLPVSILCGFFIRDMADSSSFGWLVFGIIFGFFVCCLIMEVIFRLDIKCAFHHWKQLIFNGACLVLIVVVFKYDVMGYNTYVPGNQELDGCAVSIDALLDIDVEERTQRYGYHYVSATDYRFEHMNILDNPSAMTLARKAAADGLKLMEYKYYEGIEDSPEYQESMKREKNYRMISFKYTKKNGKNVYRRYYVDITDEETLGLLADIFADSDYKLGAFPILTNGWKKEYANIECTSNDFYDTVLLSPERQAKLFEVYQSDLMKLTLDEVMNTIPLGNMSFRVKGYSRNSYGGSEGDYKIYPQFTATIELLKEYGFDYTQKLSADQVKEITVERYYDELVEADSATEDVAAAAIGEQYNNVVALEYMDKENIEAILPRLVNEELLSGLYSWYTVKDDDINITVYYDKEGIEISNRYCFYGEEKLNFIEEDFKEKAEEMKKEFLSQQ